jgi:hypothetical protein
MLEMLKHAHPIRDPRHSEVLEGEMEVPLNEPWAQEQSCLCNRRPSRGWAPVS